MAGDIRPSCNPEFLHPHYHLKPPPHQAHYSRLPSLSIDATNAHILPPPHIVPHHTIAPKIACGIPSDFVNGAGIPIIGSPVGDPACLSFLGILGIV